METLPRRTESESSAATDQVRRGDRFAFGENWGRFLDLLDEERIAAAEESLRTMYSRPDLAGESFLDVGSGSGLFSLAARRLGARVHSVDYDPAAVACTIELRRRYFPNDTEWRIESGSAIDAAYMRALSQYDYVYSWGVLHHTGEMWKAIELTSERVADGGLFFLSIYNDQGRGSRMWRAVKKTYNRLPSSLRFIVLWPAALRMWGPTIARDLVHGHPTRTVRNYSRTSRGMSVSRDVVDWVGGYPFEVAKPEEVFDFLHARGFALEKLKTCGGGIGCNEYVLRKTMIVR